MTSSKRIVLDANILLRAVLGKNVGTLLEKYNEEVSFYTAKQCYDEAKWHLPTILSRKGVTDTEAITKALETLTQIVYPIDLTVYESLENEAKERIAERDPNDWSLVALSLLFDCPIWTEDKDFFGTGIAVWNTRNVEIYLSG